MAYRDRVLEFLSGRQSILVNYLPEEKRDKEGRCRSVLRDIKRGFSMTNQNKAHILMGVAMCFFHEAYMYGEFGDRSAKMAIQPLKISAKLGFEPAQYCLALCYLYGIGVPEDPDEPERYCPSYRKFAHNTSADKYV